MIKIYHNNRCSKSREGLCFLKDKNLEIEVINYMQNPPSIEELKEIIQLLNIKPIELVRTKEVIWREQFKDKNLTDDEIVDAMCRFPQLIERPIVINDNKAVLARPSDKINEIL